MKVSAVSGDLLIKLGLGVGVALLALYMLKKSGGVAAQVAGKIGAAINPASPDNIINKGVSAAGAAVTGDEDWNLGGWLYEMFNPDPMKQSGLSQSEREAIAEMQRESRRGSLDAAVLSDGAVFDHFGNEIYVFP